jgi:hypothetical protein
MPIKKNNLFNNLLSLFIKSAQSYSEGEVTCGVQKVPFDFQKL